MKVIVGISDMRVSNNPEDQLVTYSLGSCIGVVIWDPVVKVGGMLHYMLPDSSIDPERAKGRPFMFADSGIPRLFKESYGLGAVKSRLLIYVVGGSQIMDSTEIFNIGKRNYMFLRKMFWKNKIMITKENIGGMVNRTVWLDVGTGRVHLKISGGEEVDL